MAKYIMALDAGTTSSRCILFNERGEMRSMAQKEFTQYFPRPGWVEHDGEEIWSTQLEVAQEAMKNLGITANHIAAIGITNQRETTLVWDKSTGEPIHHAIVWQCRRTAEYCDSLKAKGLVDAFRAKTGLVIDAYFSGTKLRVFAGQRPRRPGAGGAGGAALRHGGDLADLEADPGAGPHHRLLQRGPHHDVQHQHPGLGR